MVQFKGKDLKIVIFSAIGVFNTLLDLALYVVFYNLTKSIIISNLISTSFALVGSYLLNSRITFKSKQWTIKSFMFFVAVTVFGLWVLQTGIIYVLNPLVHQIPTQLWSDLGGFQSVAITASPKIVATGVTFIWNFVWYSKVIFRKEQMENKTEEVVVASII